jgi:hypothetical protein
LELNTWRDPLLLHPASTFLSMIWYTLNSPLCHLILATVIGGLGFKQVFVGTSSLDEQTIVIVIVFYVKSGCAQVFFQWSIAHYNSHFLWDGLCNMSSSFPWILSQRTAHWQLEGNWRMASLWNCWAWLEASWGSGTGVAPHLQ